MSLINEVLQDLDQRGRAGEPRGPLQFATILGANQGHDSAGGRGRRLRQVGWRLPLGMLVTATALAGILIGFGLNAIGSPDRSSESQVELPLSRAGGPTRVLASETEVASRAVSDQPDLAAVSSTTVSPQLSAASEKAVLQSVTSNSDAAPLGPTQATSPDRAGPVSTASTAGPAAKVPASPEQANLVAAEPEFIKLRNAVEPPKASKAKAPSRVAKSLPSFAANSSNSTRPLADAQQAIGRGDWLVAEQLLQRHLGEVPEDRPARELLVGLLLRGERFPAAMEHLNQGLAHAPRHTKFVLIKARLLAQSGDKGGALRLLESLPRVHDGRVEAAQMLGALYQQQGRYADAVASYRELLGLKPNYGPAWVGYAISLDGTGEATALAAYRRALRLGGVPAAAAQYAQERIAQLEAGGE